MERPELEAVTITGGPMQARVARGVTWTILDVWGRQALNLATFVILANLLVPADFGLVALAAVFVTLAQVVVDQGLGDALIQRRELTPSHMDTAFWASVATGVGLTLAGQLLASPVASALGEPDLEPILRVLSLTFVISGMTSIQIGLLRRQLAFRSLALRTFVAVSAGGIAGVALAYAHFGAWALVGQQLTAAVVSVLMLWWVLDWRPALRFSKARFGELYGFSVNVMASDVLGYLSRNMDNLLIGAVLGTVPLGLYAVGYRILDTTQQLLISVTRKVTFPALSALQADAARMERAYFRLSRASSAVIVPGYVAMALVAPELTIVLFGSRWAESGVVAAILFASGPVLSLQAFSGPLLYAAGRPGVHLRFQLISTVTNIAGFIIAVPFGIAAVAIAFTARAYLLVPLNLYWSRKYAGISVIAYLQQLRGIGVATLCMAVILIAVKLGIGVGQRPVVLILIEFAAAAIAYLATMYAMDRPLMREILDVASHAIPRFARSRAVRSQPELPGEEIQ